MAVTLQCLEYYENYETGAGKDNCIYKIKRKQLTKTFIGDPIIRSRQGHFGNRQDNI